MPPTPPPTRRRVNGGVLLLGGGVVLADLADAIPRHVWQDHGWDPEDGTVAVER